MLLEVLPMHRPDTIALKDEGIEITYGEIVEKIDEKVEMIKSRKIQSLGITLDNSAEWVLWDLAAFKAEIVCVPIPPFFSEEQTQHTIQTATITHIITPHGLQETGVRYDANKFPEGTAKVTFTSGTTGQPKGVCLSKEGMETVAYNLFEAIGSDFVGHHLCVLPLAVLLENVAGVYTGLIAGCTVHLMGLVSFGAHYQNLYQALHNTQATSAILVPEILKSLIAQCMHAPQLDSLKFVAVGGSKVDPHLIDKANILGLPVYEGYGLSECGSVVSLNTPKNHKSGTCGKLLPHIHVSIKDGEIEIKDPVFLGYIGETAPPIFPTGDLGDIKDGYLHIEGRKKNVIITSYGRNISPEWLESKLLATPHIMQAIVYGDAQPHLSALIVSISPTNEEVYRVVEKINATLPEYAQIKDIQIVPPFTLENGLLTGTGRPKRQKIIHQFVKENHHEFLRQTS